MTTVLDITIKELREIQIKSDMDIIKFYKTLNNIIRFNPNQKIDEYELRVLKQWIIDYINDMLVECKEFARNNGYDIFQLHLKAVKDLPTDAEVLAWLEKHYNTEDIMYACTIAHNITTRKNGMVVNHDSYIKVGQVVRITEIGDVQGEQKANTTVSYQFVGTEIITIGKSYLGDLLKYFKEV